MHPAVHGIVVSLMSDRGWATAGKLLVAIALLAAMVVVVAMTMVIRHGISARTPSTATERILARTARHFAVPISARNMPNPVALSPGVVAEGRGHFADHCASCHANDGSGKTEIGESLYPKAPDMRGADTQRLTDGEIFYIIKNGVRLTGMPAWGDEHDDADNWKLVHFIRHLPNITPGEIEEMQQMNPISAHERQQQQEDEQFLKGDRKDVSH